MKIFGLHIVTQREWDEMQSRMLDIERHFVVERDPANGAPKKTLDQVPVNERKNMKRNIKARGSSWNQLRAWLEATDGGRNV